MEQASFKARLDAAMKLRGLMCGYGACTEHRDLHPSPYPPEEQSTYAYCEEHLPYA